MRPARVGRPPAPRVAGAPWGVTRARHRSKPACGQRLSCGRTADVCGSPAERDLHRHLRRMRSQSRSRRDTLLAALARHCPGWRVGGAAAGLSCVAEVPDAIDIGWLVEQSAAHSVRLYPLSGYTGRSPIRQGLVCGYATLNERGSAEGVHRVGRVGGRRRSVTRATGQAVLSPFRREALSSCRSPPRNSVAPPGV